MGQFGTLNNWVYSSWSSILLQSTLGSQLLKDCNKVAITWAAYENHGSSFSQRNEMFIAMPLLYMYKFINGTISLSVVS